MITIPYPENPFHTDNLKTIPLLEAQGFEGIDASLEISLFEYDCIWRCVPAALRDHQVEDYLFVFSVGVMQEGRPRQFARIGKSSCDFASDTSWIKQADWESFLSTHGATKTEWMDLPYPVRVNDLYRHFGYMNIFGNTIYGGAFTIRDPDDGSDVQQFIEELQDPDMVGSTEYRTVYDLVEGCEDLDEAKAVCEELKDVVTTMLNKINNVLSLH